MTERDPIYRRTTDSRLCDVRRAFDDRRIGADRHVIEAHPISGDPLLTQAAIEAVRQWLYRPTLMNGQPVEVSTTVDVNFILAQ